MSDTRALPPCHGCVPFGPDCCQIHARNADGGRPGYWDGIPPMVLRALLRHWRRGMETGRFVRSCLENELVSAIGRADEDSFRAIREIVMFLYNDLPTAAWGSQENVEAWQGRMISDYPTGTTTPRVAK